MSSRLDWCRDQYLTAIRFSNAVRRMDGMSHLVPMSRHLALLRFKTSPEPRSSMV